MNFLKKHFGTLLLISLLILSAIAHAYNMFHFPAYFDDEGTYTSQAWSILYLGKLAPYTYWYDHAPLGAIFLAIWAFITGGFFTLGTSLNSGRVFMLVIQLLNVVLLYKIGVKIGNKLTSFIAIILFSLSPLAITLHRMIFLDNIMVFWILLSLYFLLKKPFRISFAILSAIALGLATLIKESGLFFIPPFFAVLVFQSHKKNRQFILVKWVAVLLGTLSFYLLFALLKGELFSANLLNSAPHVSLIDTFLWQTSRHGGFFLDKSSEFYYTFFQSWIYTDKLLIVGGIVTTLLNLIIGIKKRNYLVASLPSLFYAFYLIRGGIINDQYLIPILPFFALNIALFLSGIFSIFKNKLTFIKYFLFLVAISGITFFYSQNLGLYVLDNTKNQIDTISWLKNNTNGKVSVGDAYALVDMWYGTTKDVYTYDGYQHYWKAEDDPELQTKLLPNGWRNMDYLVITPRMERDFQVNTFPTLKGFLKEAYLEKVIDDKKQINVPSANILISAGGPIKIYKKLTEEEIILNLSWNYYKGTFIKSYGQSIDPAREFKTTSEGQSYAMLRAVFENDHPTFDGVWSWTKDHLQYRTKDKLISWLWGEKNGKEQQIDSANATDADEDIALSLILASYKWNNPKYLTEAKILIDDIWKNCVVKVNGRYYLIAGAGFKEIDGNVINPSYLSPATYKVFSEVDTKHAWKKLSDDSYFTLNQINKLKNNTSKLPTNWILLKNGSLVSSEKYTGGDSGNYGFDAFRTMWRVSLDAQWFKDPNAINYLKSSAKFYNSEYDKNKNFYSIYSLDGKPIVSFTSLSTAAGPLANFTITDQKKAGEIYNNLFLNKFDFKNGFWGDKNNYYDQNWAWFATALYTKSLSIPSSIISAYNSK